MLSKAENLFNSLSFKQILLLGIVFRLIAVVFSKGYGMFDDHYVIIESAYQFFEKGNYHHWLDNSESIRPGHSFFYVGIHYLLLWLYDFFGIENPQGKMFIFRLLHAAWSLFTIIFGYKIVKQLATEKLAKITALLLGTLWFMPFVSVRNLVEVACIPPLLIAYWQYISKKSSLKYILIGGLLAIACAIRFQSGFFVLGWGIALLIKKELKGVFLMSISFWTIFFITQITDIFFFKQPFHELYKYIEYNLLNSTTYFNRPWYMYFGTVLFLIIPPFSLLFLYVFPKALKKQIVLCLPPLLFFIFHSYFPNKQERFILPVIPFFVIISIYGLYILNLSNKSKTWIKKSTIVFGLINCIMLFAATTTYSKKSKVEAMYHFYKNPTESKVIIANRLKEDIYMLPYFYADKKYSDFKYITSKTILSDFKEKIGEHEFVLFCGSKDIENRINLFSEKVAKVEFIKEFEPSFLDLLVHKINPINKNETIYLYSIKHEF